jgi:hypothetical protein
MLDDEIRRGRSRVSTGLFFFLASGRCQPADGIARVDAPVKMPPAACNRMSAVRRRDHQGADATPLALARGHAICLFGAGTPKHRLAVLNVSAALSP